MSESLQVSLVTPEREVFTGDAAFVVVPGYDDGEVGFLPGHAAYVGKLGFGEMRVRDRAGAISRFAVFEGFVEVWGDVVTVLASHAVPAAEITEAKMEEARRELASMPNRTDEEHEARGRKMREIAARAAVLRRRAS
jgi:F-type H+-transporting ATPase subunit epsilon